MDTTLQAALGNVSVILFLNNDDQKLPRGPNNFFDPLVSELNSESYMTCLSSSDVFSATEVNHHNKKMRHLESKCQDIIFNLKVKLCFFEYLVCNTLSIIIKLFSFHTFHVWFNLAHFDEINRLALKMQNSVHQSSISTWMHTMILRNMLWGFPQMIARTFPVSKYF